MTNGEKFEEVFGKKNWFDEEYVEPKPEPHVTSEQSHEEVRRLLLRDLTECLYKNKKAYEEGKYREMTYQTNTCLYIIRLLARLEESSQK